MASDTGQDFVVLDDGDLQDYNEKGLLPQSPDVLKQIYDWLEPTAYDDGTSEYLRHLKSHVQGTGDWLTATDEYRRWHDSRNESVLWIKAVPGAGKSVLAAHQRAHLSITEKAPVLHFFFRQIITSNRTPKQLIRDWIAQLIPYSPPLQKQLYETIKTDRKALDDVGFDDLWQMAQGAIQALPRVYCFVDALDEMSLGYDEFLTLLVRLGAIIGCKVFMTSRPVPRVVEVLRKEYLICITLGPENMEEDISMYVDHRLDRDLARYIDHRLQTSRINLGDESSREPTEDLIRTTLRRKAQGSFLYARLMMDNLLEALQKTGNVISSDNIRFALDALPTGLSEMYSGMLRDHAQRTGTPRELQLSILRWVTHSERPLRLLELSAMIDFEGGTLQRAKDTKSIVRTACGPLLEIMPSDVVGPVHHSFTEYLTASRQPDSAESQPVRIESASTHRVIAGQCIKYILFVYETDDNCEVPAEDLYMGFPFLSYALHHWHAHVRKSGRADIELMSLLDRLLLDESRWRTIWLEVAMKFRPRPSPKLLEQYLKGEAKAAKNLTTPVHTSARANLGEYVTRLHDLGHDLNAWDNRQQTPVHHAADSGSVDSLKALLRAGADLNEADCEGLTPLHLAASKDRAEAVEVLLVAGVDPFTPKTKECSGMRCGNAKPTVGDTPVEYAATRGHLETSKVFARYVGAERLPYILFWALQGGHSKIALAILQEPSFNANGEIKGMYPLYMACLNRDLQCMQTLIDRGASVNSLSHSAIYAWPTGRIFTIDDEKNKNMPLHGFVCGRRGHSRPGKALKMTDDELTRGLDMLLDAGCQIDAKDGEGFSPLYHAQSDYLLTLHLLARGADPKLVMKEDGTTPLHVVAGADLSIMKLWMKYGFDINARDDQGLTPLLRIYSRSISAKECDKIRNLLALGADPNLAMRSGTTPLHLARCGRDDSMTMLLEAGADVHARDSSGNTPVLVEAIGCQEIAVLLKAGADLEARNKRGETAFLSQIARGAHLREDNLAKFLDFKPNIFARDAEGATALHLACMNIRISVLEKLFDVGLSPTAADHWGNTVFHYWMERGQHDDSSQMIEKYFQIFTDQEVDPRQANIFGHTPLHIAVFNSSETMVAVLVGSRCNLNINATDHQGLTPIHIAAARSTSLTALLLEKGADPTSITRTGQTVLHFAAVAGKPDTLALLLSSIMAMKAHLTDFKDDQQYTALHYAARSGVSRSVKLLLDAGADSRSRICDVRKRSILTPLHLCCQSKMENEMLVSLKQQQEATSRPQPNKSRSWYRLQEDWQTWSKRLSVKNPYNRSGHSAKQCIFHLLEAGADIVEGLDTNTFGAAYQIFGSFRSSQAQNILEYALEARNYSLVDELLRAIEARFAKNDANNPFSAILQSIEFGVYGAEKKHIQKMLHTTADQTELDKLIQYLIDQDRSELLQYFNGDWHLLGQHLRRLAELGHWQTLHLIRPNLANFKSSPQDFVPSSWPQSIGLMPHWASERFSKEPIEKILPAPLDGLLLAACKGGCRGLDVVKTIVEEYGCSNIEKTWALFQTKDDEILEYLVQHGANLNVQTPAGKTVLLDRCGNPPASNPTTNIIATILRNGADPNILDATGESCLSMAADNFDVVKLLMAHGADPQRGTPRPIIRAIASLKPEVVRLLVGSSADLNTEGNMPNLQGIALPRHEERKRIDEQQYPLLYALTHHYPLKHYHFPAESHDMSSEWYADLQDEVLRVLLEAGADPYAVTSSGSSILHEALLKGKRLGPVIELPDLDLERRDAQGRTLLLAAVDAADNWVVGKTCQNNLQKLLEIGARIDAVDFKGRNVLHCIANNFRRSVDMVKAVIDRPDGEKLMIKPDQEGRLAIHVLQAKQDWRLHMFLSDRGANVGVPDPEGNSVLHWLFLFNGVHQNFDDADAFSSFVRSVLAFDVDINRLNNNGEPALMNLMRGIMQATTSNRTPWRVAPPSPPGSTVAPADKEAQAVNDYMWTFNFLRNEAGMDVHVRSAHAQNALHALAAQKADARNSSKMAERVMRELWKLLVDAGLDPWEEDDEQRSALDIAAASGNVAIMEMY